ncbi:hypothetical protein pb186bvf_017356 [Paramecium bursaria]
MHEWKLFKDSYMQQYSSENIQKNLAAVTLNEGQWLGGIQLSLRDICDYLIFLKHIKKNEWKTFFFRIFYNLKQSKYILLFTIVSNISFSFNTQYKFTLQLNQLAYKNQIF